MKIANLRKLFVVFSVIFTVFASSTIGFAANKSEKPEQSTADAANKTDGQKKSKDDAAKTTKPQTTEKKPASPPIKLGCMKDGKRVIKTMAVEDYLRGVLPKEMPPQWNGEALKAQATAARTFALKNIGRHSADGFDLCDTTHCQLYDEKAINANTDDSLRRKTDQRRVPHRRGRNDGKQ